QARLVGRVHPGFRHDLRPALRSDLLGEGLDPGVDRSAVEEALLHQNALQGLDAKGRFRRQVAVKPTVDFGNPVRTETRHWQLPRLEQDALDEDTTAAAERREANPEASAQAFGC